MRSVMNPACQSFDAGPSGSTPSNGMRVLIVSHSPVECVMRSCSLRRSTPALAAMVVASAVFSICAA